MVGWLVGLSVHPSIGQSMLILKLEVDLDYCPQPTARNICCRLGRSVSRSVHCLVGHFVSRSVSQSVGRLVCCLVGQSIGWLVGRLVGQSLAILGQEDGSLLTFKVHKE